MEEHHEHNGEERSHSYPNLIEGLKDCEALVFNHCGWRLIEDLKVNSI